ncbi:MAG: hypothetical protein DSM107014_03675 [Gomphosphaeria aponina SAG 52.96 = DSM 107014]|uniref:Uncharacterized protein n=1 Tax=Gomphosphaeria aponina SAG 52.96 = DSM 107014 TaxID=1521640 RepID=A0A941GNI7_9CHRO|nr:hypothetical protein [Gomphosphaeria aponina SAG 52.96 = DSM 107014]
MALIICSYFTIALGVVCVWLRYFILDETTPKTDISSWIFLLVLPLFWPLVLPMCILELATKKPNILIINTEAENEKAVAIVEELLQGQNRSSEEQELYDLLITLIEKEES